MTPLVLVHGFMGGAAQWEAQVEALSDKREVISLDLPGFGANAALPAIDHVKGFADWVLSEVSQRGFESFDLLGHSMGGMIVQEIARSAPERVHRLVLYATGAVGAMPGRFETIAQSKERAREDGARATARRVSATWFLEGERAAGYPACAAIAENASGGAIEAGLTAIEAFDGTKALPHLKPQTLVLWGEQDRSYNWAQIERLWKSIPNAQLAVVPGCAHAVHLEKPDLFNAILADFLNS